MTWSILARVPETGEIGIAIATRFFAVGALCPHGDGRFGVLSTQALMNPLYARRGLRMLEEGMPAGAIVEALTSHDGGRAQRQVHVMTINGDSARHTGSACVDWCGHLEGPNVSVAGNMLAGAGVVEATRDAFLAGAGLPFAERLIAALEAGEAKGGDKRGKQSAAVKIWRGEDYPVLDFRVDDHADPLKEMRRLWDVAHERFIPFSSAFATRANPAGIVDRAEIDRRIAEGQAKRAVRPGYER